MRSDKGTKRKKPFNLKQARRKNKMLSSDAAYFLFGVSNVNKDTETNEKAIRPEERYCSHFGCGQKLSLMEKLCGDKCAEHMVKKTFLFCNGKL